ncbi:MAG: amino acid ABC transporter permease [Chloroflexi bacterium]|nr:amino acid ABC transporter permease [Chloroflexota bacterium]
METDLSPMIGNRLSKAQQRDWRLLVLAAGVALILVAYFMPMYPNYIASARTSFSGGTTIELNFPALINAQFYTQTTLPKEETLSSVSIHLAPARFMHGSGYGWLVQALTADNLEHVLSFIVCLLVPVVAAITALTLLLFAWTSKHGLREGLIAATLSLSLVAPMGLVLSWLHQIDFSGLLLRLEPSYLLPSAGFWIALAGTLLLLTAMIGLQRESERRPFTWWALVFAVGFVAFLLVKTKPQPYLEIWRYIQDGIFITLRIVVISFFFILIVSLIGGLGRVSRSPVIYGIASLYVELIRGIPLMVQLLFIWFALPQLFDVLGMAFVKLSPSFSSFGQTLIDLRLSPFTAAVIGLTICYGAYVSEIFRAGISSIHHGQMEAARSLGMSYMQAMRYIILPQAIRVILPPVGNEFVALLKDSSLVSVLAVSDLTRRGREYMARTFLSFETWIMVALCYLVLTLFSSRVVEYIETKTRFEH